MFAREYRAGTNYMHHATFQPSCYCPVTQRRQQAVLNNLEKYNKICTKNSEHNAWMHCSDRVWLTIAKIPTSRHNIAVFLLLWKLSVNCKQLVLAGEVQQKVDWMWLANVLVVFGRPAVKRNAECRRDNVLLLCAHVMQWLIVLSFVLGCCWHSVVLIWFNGRQVKTFVGVVVRLTLSAARVSKLDLWQHEWVGEVIAVWWIHRHLICYRIVGKQSQCSLCRGAIWVKLTNCMVPGCRNPLPALSLPLAGSCNHSEVQLVVQNWQIVCCTGGGWLEVAMKDPVLCRAHLCHQDPRSLYQDCYILECLVGESWVLFVESSMLKVVAGGLVNCGGKNIHSTPSMQ